MLNFKNIVTKVSLYFSEYIFLLWRRRFFLLFITSKSEILLDTCYVNIKEMLGILMQHTPLRFNKLSDIIVYDRPQYLIRFVVSYVLNNTNRDLRIRVRFAVRSKYTIIPSITNMIYSSSWAEREAMDLFGIKFIGHPDLRRILGDYGLWGFPGRKDFPLVGLYSYFYALNFLRVFRVRGTLSDFWSIYFQKKIAK